MAREINKKTLEVFRKQLLSEIKNNYNTVEEFCWDKDLSKATISNVLNKKKDFFISTLEKIANALNKELIIKLK